MGTKIPVLSVYDEAGNRIPIPAIRGKSAYAYAQDGGYTGTEEDFAKKLAQDVPEGGGSGGDYIPVPATASVGQTIKVSAVDADGKPTAWEAVDPDGWDVFYRYTTEEDLTEGFKITEIDGEAIAFKEMFVRLRLVNTTEGNVSPYVRILTDWNGNQSFQPQWSGIAVNPNKEVVLCAEAKLLGNGVFYCDWYWYTHAQVCYQNGGNHRRTQNPSQKVVDNEQSMFDFVKYNVIKGLWCSTTVSAGTDIEIWGRKL